MTELMAVQKQDTLKGIMRSDEVRTRFAEVVGGNNAGGYISSVLIAVSESQSLQKCTATSIIGAALRAATMRLSVEPSAGQAYLVPFKDKATLVVGWRGIYHMALRTSKYRFINLITVYQGETVNENRMTGIHTLEGKRTSEQAIGYMLYFRLISGFEKTYYMTCDECLEHGQRYSKSFNREDSIWKSNPEAMMKKTVMRLGLLRWGYLEPSDLQSIKANDEDEVELSSVVDAVTRELQPEKQMPEAQAMAELGFDEPKAVEKVTEEVIEEEPAPVTAVSREDVKKMAQQRGVDSRGLDELYAKADGDVFQVAQQLQAL